MPGLELVLQEKVDDNIYNVFIGPYRSLKTKLSSVMPAVIDNLYTPDFMDQTIQDTPNYDSGTFWASDTYIKHRVPYACVQ